jgi:hypothetical protein
MNYTQWGILGSSGDILHTNKTLKRDIISYFPSQLSYPLLLMFNVASLLHVNPYRSFSFVRILKNYTDICDVALPALSVNNSKSL